jgi:hypothetical protein
VRRRCPLRSARPPEELRRQPAARRLAKLAAPQPDVPWWPSPKLPCTAFPISTELTSSAAPTLATAAGSRAPSRSRAKPSERLDTADRHQHARCVTRRDRHGVLFSDDRAERRRRSHPARQWHRYVQQTDTVTVSPCRRFKGLSRSPHLGDCGRVSHRGRGGNSQRQVGSRT